MCQRIKIAKANLYRIPARKIVTHGVFALSFLLGTLPCLDSSRTDYFKTITLHPTPVPFLLLSARFLGRGLLKCSGTGCGCGAVWPLRVPGLCQRRSCNCHRSFLIHPYI